MVECFWPENMSFINWVKLINCVFGIAFVFCAPSNDCRSMNIDTFDVDVVFNMLILRKVLRS